MDDVRTLIRQVDDDYLIGLGNKGILKRAYKDLEQETPTVTWQKDMASVALKEETCLIRSPLGESSCSCPSRSICRHVVTAILWLKKELAAEPEGGAEPRVFQSFLDIPADRLQRACGSRNFRQLLGHIQVGERPAVTESSIVTVTFPWDTVTVKLLEPLEHSSCTCHSRELCTHKAQALLAYQLLKGKIERKDLEVFEETENAFDEAQVKQAAAAVRETIGQQICTGLSRQSREAPEAMERLAVICHRAGLADFESRLREIGGEYRGYFERSAAFRNSELLTKLLRLYWLAGRLMAVSDQEGIRFLAGSFRDTFQPAGRLHLIGMGARSFQSKTGYEGETYYFLERDQKTWYTWTDVRPVFYEGVRRRPAAAQETAAAPWGLPCSREKMMELAFDLTGAKAASGGRLSSSQETRAEVTGSRDTEAEEISQMISWDYEALLRDNFEFPEEKSGRRERLALVGAVRWGETSFDEVSQRFSWSLYDPAGRKFFVSLKYTKEEQFTISLLERLERRLKGQDRGSIVFFGSLYLEEGRLCLYPIEFFLRQTGGPEPESETAGETSPGFPGEPCHSHIDPSVLETMRKYLAETSELLADLFSGGLLSAEEETVSRLLRFSEDGERLGLHLTGEELSRIRACLEEKRHRTDFSPEPVLTAMGRMDRYLSACTEKLSFDRALHTMNEEEENKAEKTGKGE